jgi:hypothetical protein
LEKPYRNRFLFRGFISGGIPYSHIISFQFAPLDFALRQANTVWRSCIFKRE